MGRPTNKRHFGDGATKIACTARIGAGNELCFITSQRSNSKYAVDSEAGPSTRSGVCTLVQGAPNAENEMQVTVTPELSQVGVQATVTITTTTGNIDTAVIANAGFGYFSAGTGVVILGGGGDGTLDYTVANGSLTSVTLQAAGTGYSNGTEDIADAPDANPPAENAKIINARTVKTFEGNTYMWPAVGGAGTTKVRLEADLQTQ